MNIQWYPGHMTKARRMMQDNIKLVDLVIELVDARVPLSSRNPDIDDLGRNKARLLLLNKADLADEAANEAWSAYFRNKGFQAVKLDSRSKAGFKAVQAAVQKVADELGSDGRILVRESGTEPVIRVMVEAASDEICEKYVDSVVEVIEAEGLTE